MQDKAATLPCGSHTKDVILVPELAFMGGATRADIPRAHTFANQLGLKAIPGLLEYTTITDEP